MAGINGVSTPAVAAAGVGALVLWSALKGASLTSGFRSLLGGKAPSGADANPITGVNGTAPASAAPVTANTSTSSAIANDGLSYVGTGTKYKWGGGDPSGWDCSGFCNYVVGHDLRSPIPGSPSGSYSGHGPVTGQWALFGTSVKSGQEQPGDVVIWPLFHMGIVTGNGQMVNCPGPAGTPAPIVSSYNNTGIPGPRVFRRIGTTYQGPH